MIGHWVQIFHTLAGIYRLTSVYQVIQTIKPIVFSGEANYKRILDVDNLCK